MSNRILLSAAAAAALVFGAGAASADVVDFNTMQLNGSPTAASVDGSGLHLGDGVGGEQMSAFLTDSHNVNQTFSGSFDFVLEAAGFDPQADGIAFVMQGNDPFALGGGGGGIGANGIPNSAGIAFQSWDNNHAGIFTGGDIGGNGAASYHNYSLGFYTANSTPPDGFAPGDAIPVDHVHVTFSYNGHDLSYSAFNSDTGESISGSRHVLGALNGNDYYLGFTGGSGLSWANQTITNWDLNFGGIGGVPEPATWTMMIAGFGLLGGVIRRRRGALAAA